MKVYGKTIDFKHTRLEDAKRFEKAVSNMADANEKDRTFNVRVYPVANRCVP